MTTGMMTKTIAGPFSYKHIEGCNGIYHAACSLQLFMMGLIIPNKVQLSKYQEWNNYT